VGTLKHKHMNKTYISSLFLLTIGLWLSSCSSSDEADPKPNQEVDFYFSNNFDSYENGVSLSSMKPFDAAGRTTVSNEQSYSGQYSAKMEIHEGDAGGFGLWGGLVPLSPGVKKGGEVWVRLRIYWPSSFVFSATPYMKFMRLHNKTSAGENGGYNDLYIDKANATTQVMRCIKEYHNIWEVYDGDKIPRDTWETYEMYIAVDDVSVDKGGQGRMRIWRDGALIFDRTDVPTITEAQGEIKQFNLFTYWNNEMPPTNHVYVDDMVIATHVNPPLKKDSKGNYFIGH